MHAKQSIYYPHIDGVRAIAVLSVLFYHVGWTWFGGGFVGVDVFFVISGYLITSHLLDELQAGRLRLKDFYVRRVRRLGPALMVTLGATFLVGALLLPPAGLERLGHATITATLSVSNIFFWTEAGYFDTAAVLKPVLHTWSLGVEEQFYLVWPALIMLAFRWRRTVTVIVTLGVVSLVLAEVVIRVEPSAAFFLTPFRMAEFGIGALLVTSVKDRPAANPIQEVVTLSGLALIAYSVVTYSHDTPFPGLHAMVPCLGAAALIYGGTARWSGRLLRNRLFVGVGLISYSLYLAHWPVIVYWRYWRNAPLSLEDQILTLAMSCLLGYLMYRYIELPFRRPRSHPGYFTPGRLGLWVGTAASLVVLVAGHASIHDGWSWRPAAANALTAREIALETGRRFDLLRKLCAERGWDRCDRPLPGQRNVLILGDSHGPDGLNILETAFPNEHFSVSFLSGCPPLVPVDTGILLPTHPDRNECIALNQKRFDPVYLAGFDVVVISVLFEWYRPEHLAAAIDAIQAAGVKHILVFGNFIKLNEDLTDILARGLDPRRDARLVKSFDLYHDELRDLAATKGFRLISKAHYLCRADADPASCSLTLDDGLALYDQHHLSWQAAQLIGEGLARDFHSLDALIGSR